MEHQKLASEVAAAYQISGEAFELETRCWLTLHRLVGREEARATSCREHHDRDQYPPEAIHHLSPLENWVNATEQVTDQQ
jgi:hypothetical protein